MPFEMGVPGHGLAGHLERRHVVGDRLGGVRKESLQRFPQGDQGRPMGFGSGIQVLVDGHPITLLRVLVRPGIGIVLDRRGRWRSSVTPTGV